MDYSQPRWPVRIRVAQGTCQQCSPSNLWWHKPRYPQCQGESSTDPPRRQENRARCKSIADCLYGPLLSRRWTLPDSSKCQPLVHPSLGYWKCMTSGWDHARSSPALIRRFGSRLSTGLACCLWSLSRQLQGMSLWQSRSHHSSLDDISCCCEKLPSKDGYSPIFRFRHRFCSACLDTFWP